MNFHVMMQIFLNYMITDCEKSITYLLNWFEKQDFNSLRLDKLNNHCNFIQLYVLCYSPFLKATDNNVKCI